MSGGRVRRWTIAPVLLINVASLQALVAVAAPMQDALQPAGPQAGHIHALWQLMLVTSSVVLVAVVIAVLLMLRRAPRGDPTTPADVDALSRDERGLRRSVGAAIAVSVAGLLVVFGATVVTDRALAQLPLRDGVHITLIGHLWWWEATYDDAEPSNVFSTANELHIPVGRPVVLSLEADDVIHSFWVPNLHGKKDLIPGRTATLALRADAPGIYRGQCAEFCGYQHANMALVVIAESPERYAQWLARSRATAPSPSNDTTRRGQQVFLQSTCAMCHAISGTPANGRRAPDLTHVALRGTLAAGTLRNEPAALAAWILDPQRIKPGSHMPANALSPADMQALVAYLETLQ
jgi:cytochrome c oxidase subunit 2